MFPAQETNIRAVFSSCSYQYRKTFGKCRKVSGRKEHTYCSPPGNNPCAFGRRTCGPFPSSACAREHVHMRACVRAGARAGWRACACKRLPAPPPPTPAHALCCARAAPRPTPTLARAGCHAQSPSRKGPVARTVAGRPRRVLFPGSLLSGHGGLPSRRDYFSESPRRPPRASGPHRDSRLLRLPGSRGQGRWQPRHRLTVEPPQASSRVAEENLGSEVLTVPSPGQPAVAGAEPGRR